jgi:hypothetical protein
MSAAPLLFHEAQPFRQRRTRLLIAIPPAGLLVLAIWQIGLRHPWGLHPMSNGQLASLTVFLWLFYLWMLRVRLVTTVDGDEIAVRLDGLGRRRRIAVAQITRAAETVFDPVRDFGGYGFRAIPHGRAYLAGGTRGIRLELAKGQTVVIGSERPGELLRAIERAQAIKAAVPRSPTTQFS